MMQYVSSGNQRMKFNIREVMDMVRGTMGEFPFQYRGFVEADETGKRPHETYDVFVNDQFVGQKVLLTQNDSITSVDDFLLKRGFQSFESQLDGIQYKIISDNEEEAQRMKQNLDVYLHIR